jgi:hypothetical protein
MNRTVLVIAGALLAGAAGGALFTGSFVSGNGEQPMSRTGTSDGRLARLEQIVSEEREARIVLEDTLAILFEELDRIENAGAVAAAAVTDRPAPPGQSASAAAATDRRRPGDDTQSVASFSERRISRLVESGFSEAEARRVLQLESEASYKALQAQWEAERSGETDQSTSSRDILRASLGDDEYARYLEANGRPSAVRVSQVLEGSPASTAGLQSGDQVVSYNGERVFHTSDLRELTMQGEPGQDVVVEIDRDGVRMQLTLPAGPIGISGSGNRGRGGPGG